MNERLWSDLVNNKMGANEQQPSWLYLEKWDLRVHTPPSVIHNYPGTEDEAWEAFLLDLEALPASMSRSTDVFDH